jgi:hypothetical protein
VSPEDADRAVAIIRDAVAGGRRSRAELAALVATEGIETAGQATAHLLGRASIEGVVVLYGERLFGAPPAVAHDPGGDRDGALAELARRYLRGHAPAADVDLAAWSGLPLRDVRRGLALAGAGDVAAPEAPAAIPPCLLPAFDPYLLGWKDRSFAVPAHLAREVHPGGGMLRAVMTEDGLVTGTWSLTDPPDADVARFLAA